MGFLKTLIVGTLAVLGGCTVVVGGCTVGATKIGIQTLDTATTKLEKDYLFDFYAKNPARAEQKYREVSSECYGQYMNALISGHVPQNVINERVEFDLYEMRIRQTGDLNNIQHLPAWRAQSDKKIIASVANKTQQRAIKKYLKKVEKGNLMERICIINEFTPKNKREEYKQASSKY